MQGSVLFLALSLGSNSAVVDLKAESPVVVASCGGKCADLMRVAYVPEDRTQYGQLHDYGWYTEHEYKGHKALPAGYYTYLAPHWYIWGAKRE